MFTHNQAAQRLYILLTITLTITVRLAFAQEQIALDTYAIFEQSCLICHGPDGAYKETLLIEHNTLIETEAVVPGNPNNSELYKRLITTEIAKRMPLGQPQLSTQSINTIRDWILAGAPDWTPTATTNGDFISHTKILNSIKTHLMSLSPFNRTFARYFSTTHLYNAGESGQTLQEYRKALFKLINSLSWGLEITNPQPINPQNTIFYIDLRHYEWDRNNAWTQIERQYPYHIPFNTPEQSAIKEQLTQLQTEMKCDIPTIHVDWFIANASLPPLYHDLLDLPLTDRELETRLEVDVTQNLTSAPGVRVWRAGTNNSGVSNNNRVIERHTSQHGAYWKSYDFAGSIGTQNIFTNPLSFTPDGGEVIFNLPNGLQAYYITNAAGIRIDAAPINIVSNPAASDPTVRNGLSCFGCHTEGMKTFTDEVRPIIKSHTNTNYDKEHALRLYVEQQTIEALLNKDIQRYTTALNATGESTNDIEPISRFYEAYQKTINADYAAAIVGLETKAFLEKIRNNIGLQNIGLLTLDKKNGSIKRDTWTSSFQDIIFALNHPEHFKPTKTPITTVITGTHIHIPDPNLRAAITEALNKSSNAPITTEDMKKLTWLDGNRRDIQDLTGIQFATNLREISLSRNQISNLSPIAGLINLEGLYLEDNQVSNLLPIAGLTNLRELSIESNPISDISAVSKLTNLVEINISRTSIPNLSPLLHLPKLRSLACTKANISDLSLIGKLTNLTAIHGWGNPISDISPLANLTKLEHIYLPVGYISDLTPLANLTELEELFFHHNEISDLTPLANLTKLEWLSLSRNNISDVSPLVNLTNLKGVGLQHNNISDISPLNKIRQNIILAWDQNPGYPKAGPNIEGPWLWLMLPNEEFDIDLDHIQKTSKGKLTETKIATNGAIEGQSIGGQTWTAHKLSDNSKLTAVLKQETHNTVIYGTISLHSPHKQDTTIFVNNNRGLKVYLNQEIVYKKGTTWKVARAHRDFFPVTLKQGRNILLVAITNEDQDDDRFHFSFKPDTQYTVANPRIEYRSTPTTIYINSTFTLSITTENMIKLLAWQFDINFDPNRLEAISTSEGDFLKRTATTMFMNGTIDNIAGKITGFRSICLSTQGTSGTGTICQIEFRAKSAGQTEIKLSNVQLGTTNAQYINAGPHQTTLTINEALSNGDVNQDGSVDTMDLILIAQQLGQTASPNSPADINNDGKIDMTDLTLVQAEIDKQSAAPPIRTTAIEIVKVWIAQARLKDDGSLPFKQGIQNLEQLLTSFMPQKTMLLQNYPNPFNPETWIPYQLAEPAEVTLTIYDISGEVIKHLEIGHKQAGIYHNHSHAIYWDGRNKLGETIASGIYFYKLTAGEFTATRRMIILK